MSTTIDQALFRETLGNYPTGVAVVTATLAGGNPVGMVVGTFSSVSLDPPLIAFFPMNTSNSFAELRTADAFCVNVLASDQEPLCRQLATRKEGKFDGVFWRRAPLGSPILEEAVSWIECTFDDIREAGDHFIVLGRVEHFATARQALPLLYFQGGYGRFSLGSFVAAPSPELIEAAQIAETVRDKVERLSRDNGVNCSIVARIGWDAVQVLAANDGELAEPAPLGHRQPLIPPFGAIFLADSPEQEVDVWLGRAPDRSDERRAVNRALLGKVQLSGFSMLTADPEAVLRHTEVLREFELSGGLPRQDRVVRQLTSDLADAFAPELVPGVRYDLASIVVRIPVGAAQPPMALRMTGLPAGLDAEQVEAFIAELRNVASAAGAVAGSRR
ncbi:flavin reductase family protein [Subtercola boreus]|uniref:Flavin reductase like domain-containing protein n=1 Tax=Subtercola boreus TaxID=120213 RepID=A0A3E0W799_9MICO|nr:flavin reductase family protein [Subtercola boreus]RFA18827.1 hypothetical protein B7R24_13905 [Subtercola boreus]RFA18941.1 hypothetical protein B7R23_13895 [Subtercola boreus]RFA25479.1 hypothetical protein B7R25_14005 [Subtercola boreus]